jgi:anthraniloyl-CoA monooxygenase
VKIACIGGGPAGLYLGILVKRVAPEHDVQVLERNRPADTFGFGVVFSDATLGHLAAADPETHREITARFARWDDIEIHVGGEMLRSTGHGFCGIERKQLLHILQTRARELGVRVEYEHEVKALAEVSGDVVVGCDGVASWVRDALAAELQPRVDVRPNKFVWLGCTVPYTAFNFIFKDTPYGLFRVHAYRYHEHGSTFIVECREDTWRAAGLAGADEDRTVAILGDVFAAELAGHELVKNRSIWRNFPTVRCGKWHAGNVVLMGDAAHTAHFSIGSGTKLAMEDAIALRDELLASPHDIAGALAAYEARRRPEVEALQAAAQASLEWFEGTERYTHMAPVQLTYSLMTRSLRVSHASVAKRDPHLARGVERLLADQAGVTADPPPSPTELPFQLGDRALASRIVVAPGDDALVAAARPGVLVATSCQSAVLDDDRWQMIVDDVHAKGALIALRLAAPAADTVARAAALGFDLLAVDRDVALARAHWRPGGWIALLVGTRTPSERADLVWVTAPADGNARMPAAPIADRLRNELGVATCVDAAGAALPDLEAAIAAGRADLVVVEHI